MEKMKQLLACLAQDNLKNYKKIKIICDIDTDKQGTENARYSISLKK